MALHVKLSDRFVGTLSRAARDRPWAFEFSDDYLRAIPRPVLGQAFEDDPGRSYEGVDGRPPPFFANLLPEGALLRHYQARYGSDEAALLAALGGDLPGAVTVEGETPRSSENDGPRFSLAGVQPKLSAMLSDGKVTMPVNGDGGAWIAKLEDRDIPELPRIEYATTQWARASGIHVSEHDLRPMASISGFPESWTSGESRSAFVVRRFDRLDGGARVHLEDFAQVFSRYPEERYPREPRLVDTQADYAAIGSVIAALCPRDDLREYVRRLVFMVLSGNADLHLKNWSLYYPPEVSGGGVSDGTVGVPRLSPAYDLVANVAVQRSGLDTSHAALHWAGEHEPHLASVAVEHFARLAAAWEVPQREVIGWVRDDVNDVRTAWAELRSVLPLASEELVAIELHLATCQLRA